MSVVAPLTTEIRGGDAEVPFFKPPWLHQECVVNLLGIAGVDNSRIKRVLGRFSAKAMSGLELKLAALLGF